MNETRFFIVQAYRAKPHRLVPLPAQVFDDPDAATRAAKRLAPFRAGIVVLSQTVDHRTAAKGRPSLLAILGTVPDDWRSLPLAA